MKTSRFQFNPFLTGNSVLLSALSITVLASASATAQTFNVTAGNTQSWNVNGNWSAAPFPNATGANANVAWDFENNLALNLGQDITVGSLTTNDTGDSPDRTITIQGNTLTFQVSSGNATWTNTNGADAVINSNLALASNLTIANATNTLRIGNNVTNTIDLGGNKLTFADSGAGAVAVGFGGSTTAGLITGTGSIEVNRTNSNNIQTIFRNSESNYSGGTSLLAGFTVIEADSTGSGGSVTKGALGTGTVTINQTGATAVRIRAATFANRILGNNILLKSNVLIGSGGNTSQLTMTGDVSLDTANAEINTESAVTTFQIFQGAIGEATAGNGLTKLGGGGLRFSGTTANTYTGLTDVNNGVLELGKTAGVNAIAGNLLIGTVTDTRVQLLASNQIADTSTVTFTGAAAATTLRLNGFNETVGSLSSGGGAGVVENNTSGTSTITVSAASGSTSFNGVLQNGAAGVLAFAKIGNGQQILSGANTYTGTTTITAGTLRINGDQSAATGVVSVAANATLGGNGTVGGATTFTGTSTHAVGSAAATVGTQNFSSTLTYGTGTIFDWDLNTLAGGDVTDPGVVSNASTGTYDQVVATGAITGGSAIFKIVLAAGDSFADVFWNTDKSWTNIFAGGSGSAANLAALFNGFDASGGVSATGLVTDRGQFTLSTTANTLNWTAVPEPTSALAGILLGAGLLRRRRTA